MQERGNHRGEGVSVPHGSVDARDADREEQACGGCPPYGRREGVAREGEDFVSTVAAGEELSSLRVKEAHTACLAARF